VGKRRRRSDLPEPVRLGWREWVSLPDLGIEAVKAKVDSGARTSSLHAVHLRSGERDGVEWVWFEVHPLQRETQATLSTGAAVVDHRIVRSSTGHAETRPVVRTTLSLGTVAWPIELTLTSRDAMGFRMLLGREALRGRALIDPGRSFLANDRGRTHRWRGP